MGRGGELRTGGPESGRGVTEFAYGICLVRLLTCQLAFILMAQVGLVSHSVHFKPGLLGIVRN